MTCKKEKKPRSKVKKSATVLRILKYLRYYKGLLALAALLTVASNVFALIAPDISGKAIDSIVGKGSVDFPKVYKYAALMLIFYAVSAILSYILASVMITLGRKTVYRMRKEVFDHLVDLPVGYFDRNQTGDIISRLSYDIDTINASLSNDLLQICTGIITVVGSAIMMFRIAPVLMLVFAVTVPALILFTIYRVKKVKPYFKARSAELGKLNGYSEEMLSGQKTIRAYGKENEMIARFDDHNNKAVEAYYKADYHGSIVGPSVNFINNISLSLISIFGALLFINGKITPGQLSSFIMYSRKFSGPINETANIISEIQSAISAAERVFRLLDEETEPSGGRELGSHGENAGLQNVTFGYDEGHTVIKDLSLNIPKGATVAIVGPTGSGKTTIINLLMRFYDPQSGNIFINGEKTSGLSLASVRSSFAMVLQDTWLFGGTIADNIAYGCDGEVSMDRIENAAKAAGIHDYIMSLPHGYDTVIDENGMNISKGQKQLMTIARAMLLDDRILILDEATSNVDSRTEAKLQSAMQNIMAGKTSIVIAHRLSTVRNADVIVVMRGGRIIEQGDHDSLMQIENGFYRSLYNSQFDL